MDKDGNRLRVNASSAGIHQTMIVQMRGQNELFPSKQMGLPPKNPGMILMY